MSDIPPLHDYQKQAVEFVRNRRRAALLLDMGLGKTCISLTALTPEMLPVLVNAPKRVAEEVWPVEVPKWRPDLRVVVAAGTPAQRKAALQKGVDGHADIVVIGRDNLADAVDYASHYNTHIIDELSGFKTRASQRWKAAKKINNHMDQVWGLTGTPSPNGLLDLWAQLYLIDGGEALGTTLGGYRERYFTAGRQMSNGVIIEWNIRPGADKRIHTLLERSCLAMQTEGRIDLPPVTDNDVSVPLTPTVRRVYKSLKDDLVADMSELGLGTAIHSAQNAAVLSNKLSQITAGFLYPDDREFNSEPATRLHKEKANVVKEIVEGTGSPVLVGYRFQEELAILKEVLGEQAHTIDEPNVVKRWNAGEIPVLVAHPDSIGHGLNLQDGGHTMIWATLPWSLEAYMQMNKRLARQGQKHPVVIHHLLSPKTVDPAIKLALQGKKSIQDAIMDHLESPL
jgi:Superfamily II DNA/RNA helicases, SNF2 family